MMSTEIHEDMMGHYSVVYSPDDAGYYAELWWTDETSPVMTHEHEAVKWAKDHGGTVRHKSPA